MACLASETCTRDEFIYLFKRKKVPSFFFTNLGLTFDYLDVNKDGAICAKDIALALNVPLEKAQEIIMCLDDDHNGLFDYKEFRERSEQFKALLISLGQSINETKQKRLALVNAFRRFDEGGQGLVDHLAFRYILRSQGETLTNEEFDDLISHAPMTQDGKIYYHKLIDYLVDPCERNETDDTFLSAPEEVDEYFDHVLYESEDGYRLVYRIKKFDPRLDDPNFNKCYKHLAKQFALHTSTIDSSESGEFAEIVRTARRKFPRRNPAYDKKQLLNYRGDKSLPIPPKYFTKTCDSLITSISTPSKREKSFKASAPAYHHLTSSTQSYPSSNVIRQATKESVSHPTKRFASTPTKSLKISTQPFNDGFDQYKKYPSSLIKSPRKISQVYSNLSDSSEDASVCHPNEEVSIDVVEIEYPVSEGEACDTDEMARKSEEEAIEECYVKQEEEVIEDILEIEENAPDNYLVSEEEETTHKCLRPKLSSKSSGPELTVTEQKSSGLETKEIKPTLSGFELEETKRSTGFKLEETKHKLSGIESGKINTISELEPKETKQSSLGSEKKEIKQKSSKVIEDSAEKDSKESHQEVEPTTVNLNNDDESEEKVLQTIVAEKKNTSEQESTSKTKNILNSIAGYLSNFMPMGHSEEKVKLDNSQSVQVDIDHKESTETQMKKSKSSASSISKTKESDISAKAIQTSIEYTRQYSGNLLSSGSIIKRNVRPNSRSSNAPSKESKVGRTELIYQVHDASGWNSETSIPMKNPLSLFYGRITRFLKEFSDF